MTQPLGTHLLTTGLSNHFVLLVDDINPLGICSLILFRHPVKPSFLGAMHAAHGLCFNYFWYVPLLCQATTMAATFELSGL